MNRTMQYGGNQQRLLAGMMMQHARQQQQQSSGQSSLYSGYPPHLQASSLPRQAKPTFVTCVTENDVLLGRGTPCAENEGNVRFRRLVKERKMEYIAAEKRMRKDAIAREILDVIASRGGKFLRKLESTAELEQLGVPHGYHSKEVWAVVDEDTQVQKVKQALRNKDDAAELIQMAKNQKNVDSSKDDSIAASNKGKYSEQDVTNRFPRGVADETNIHKADSSIQFGGSRALERADSGSEEGGKVSGSPKLKSTGLGQISKIDKAAALKPDTKMLLRGEGGITRRVSDGFLSGATGMDASDFLAQRYRRGSFNQSALASPGNQRNLLGSMPPSSRQLWDKSQAAPSEAEMLRLQEMQRIRLMREQMSGVPPGMGSGASASLGGFGPTNMALDGMYAPDLSARSQMMNSEYRQMQVAQQQQQQMQMAAAAAAREQAAMASLRNTSGAGLMGPTPTLYPSASLAARQLQMESAQRRASLVGAFNAGDSTGLPQAMETPASPNTRGKSGSDSIGERAIGIAQAMKRADAFSAADSLEMSHVETLILSVLCSHGLPVWTPEAHTKSFVTLPSFAKRLDWTWYGFASVLKQRANSSGWKNSSGGGSQPMEAKDKIATEAAIEYQRDPREMATKTIMLLEKLRRHGGAMSASSQRKQHSGLGMRVPAWLDRELSRWAMTLDIADVAGRPMAFSSTDFVAEHTDYKADPAVAATAAFDPQLADDVVDQVALLTRLRSVFVNTKGHEIQGKIEGAIQRAGVAGEKWEQQPKGWASGENGPSLVHEILLCDRLLSEGFTGVLSSTNDLGAEYQMGAAVLKLPSFESMTLTKSSLQQRVNVIARELHAMEEAQEQKILRLDRMERLAQSVLSSSHSATGEVATGLHLLAGVGGAAKRKASLDMPMNKKPKL